MKKHIRKCAISRYLGMKPVQHNGICEGFCVSEYEQCKSCKKCKLSVVNEDNRR